MAVAVWDMPASLPELGEPTVLDIAPLEIDVISTSACATATASAVDDRGVLCDKREGSAKAAAAAGYCT